MDDYFMQLAIDDANRGIEKGDGGPFGACIVKGEKVLAVAHNTVIGDKDPTCHAEMNAIRRAAQSIGDHDLSGCSIYTTSEPCPMCLAAIYWARISAIHIGAPRSVAAEFGFDDEEFYRQLKQEPQERKVLQTSGLLQESVLQLFRSWKNLSRPLY